MPTLSGLLYALRSLLRRSASDRDTADEIAFHIERETQRLIERGAAPAEAHRQALARFGGTTRWREETAEARPGHLLESVLRDTKLAVRSLVVRPAFTFPALVTLALGIGANTAVLSVVRGVVLEALPYRDSDRLAAIWQTLSAAELDYLQRNARSFDDVAAFSPGWGYSLVGMGEPMQLDVARTSGNFFRTLGVTPRVGRGFHDSEATPGQSAVVVLSHEIWAQRFGSDPAVVGRAVTMNDLPHRVVGVAPPGFEAFQPGVQAWIPFEIDPAANFYRSHHALGFGRLRAGVTFAQAEQELAAFIPRLRDLLEAPRDYGSGFGVKPLRDAVVQESRHSLFVLFGAACFILLIAGANYGNLLLLRVGSRRREVAVRTALGASRSRIARQFLIESLVLSLAGGVIGFVVGAAGVRALRNLLPPDMPRLASVSVDTGLLLACAALAVLIGMVCGAAPALLATRSAPQDALREAGGVARASGGGRMRGAMVVVEFACALVLLVGAGLMLQTAWRMQRVDPGFTAEGVLTFRLQPTSTRLRAETRRVDYFDQLIARIAAMPGVEAVGTSQHLPLTGFNWGAHIAVEDRPTEPGATPPRVTWRIVNGDYFRAMGIPLRLGRAFTAQDDSASPPTIVISETMARRHWPDENPIGKRVRFGAPSEPWTTVIGVVGDVRFRALNAPAEPEVYRPIAQVWQASAHFVVRTSGDPMRLMPAIRRVIREHDGTAPISAVRPMQAIVRQSFAQTNMVMLLLIAFAAVGLALGAVGIYGVISYDVAQRTREIGIRAALGAASGSIHGLVLRRAAILALAGIGAGGVASALSARALEALVYGVRVRDPATYVALAALLLLVALAAAFIPARRAVRVDPVSALRYD
jgi:predicted permease